MIGLLQRVTQASVEVNDRLVGRIDQGILVLVGVQKQDTENHAERLLQRLLGYRIFADEGGKMNLSVRDIKGGLLLVPQFTLAADTKKGMRPSFSSAAAPQEGKRLFELLVTLAREQYPYVGTGEFGADMKVALVNDGPVTFWLDVN
ncbi:MAG: D-tyrosyl-tRNA(Tyr) deacylase [Gammaproteobacteria bacterium SG8_11]|nr:MAG: D-tyrosyl-tRNA(Tyr) deacylase [Gammaproteobacteria bacterium SG8_11]